MLRVTGEHPLYLEGRGWAEAGEVSAGDAVRDRDGNPLRVLEVERDTTPTRVHNLEVAGAHTYFAGALEAWGHNMRGSSNRFTICGCTDEILGFTKHALNQLIGRDSGRGVSNSAILDTLRNPSSISCRRDSRGRVSTKIEGKDATVTVNDDGLVTTVWGKPK